MAKSSRNVIFMHRKKESNLYYRESEKDAKNKYYWNIYYTLEDHSGQIQFLNRMNILVFT